MTTVDLAYQAALDRLATVGFAALTERERDLVVLWQVEAGVGNGGLVHYYFGLAGNHAGHAPEALTRVGAVGKAAILRAANALFGLSGPPSGHEQRRAALQALSPQVVAAMDDLDRRYGDDADDVDDLVEKTGTPPR